MDIRDVLQRAAPEAIGPAPKDEELATRLRRLQNRRHWSAVGVLVTLLTSGAVVTIRMSADSSAGLSSSTYDASTRESRSSVPASYERSRAESPPPVAEDAVLEDAQQYAAEFDVDLEEAERRLANQSGLIARLAQLQELAGPLFAGDWIQHVPDFRGVVRLTGSLADSEEFDAVIDASPVPIEVRVESGLSFAELLAERSRLAELVIGVLPNAGTGISQKDNSLVVYTTEETVDSAGGIAEVEAEIRSLTDAPIIIRYDPDNYQRLPAD